MYVFFLKHSVEYKSPGVFSRIAHPVRAFRDAVDWIHDWYEPFSHAFIATGDGQRISVQSCHEGHIEDRGSYSKHQVVRNRSMQRPRSMSQGRDNTQMPKYVVLWVDCDMDDEMVPGATCDGIFHKRFEAVRDTIPQLDDLYATPGDGTQLVLWCLHVAGFRAQPKFASLTRRLPLPTATLTPYELYKTLCKFKTVRVVHGDEVDTLYK